MNTKTVRMDIYPSEDLRRAVDRWRIEQPDSPSRPEAARQLLEEMLILKGVIPKKGESA